MKEKSLTDERFIAIEDNIKRINDNVYKAACASGRENKDIKIMAVTKTVDPLYINHALTCGIDLIGENKVQEFLGKRDELNLEGCDVHLIGHLQTNKVRQIVGKVALIQSVDSVKVAQEIGKRSLEAGIITDILAEINIGSEVSKFGIMPGETFENVYEFSEIPGIRVCGLMSIPPNFGDDQQIRRYFSNIHRLFIDICDKKIDNVSMCILSMGMSGDYTNAILEGSNLIRLGSAVFGERIYE